MDNIKQKQVRFSGSAKWLTATNTENLKMIIAQGLIAAPSGFDKYYKDVLELSLGWLPLFKKKIPTEIIKHCVSEVENLTPCIIEFDLTNIQGTVKTFKTNLIEGEQLQDVEIQDVVENEIDLMFIPVPIPISCIKVITFEAAEDKENFELETQLYKNVSLIDLKLKVNKNYYSHCPSVWNMSEIRFPEKSDKDYSKTFAYGGMLGSAFYFAKNGPFSNSIYHAISDQKELPENTSDAIRSICSYFQNNNGSISPIALQVFHGLLDTIISQSGTVEDNIIQFLSNFEEGHFQSRAEEIANKLIELKGFSDKRVSEYFIEAKTDLEKFLIMLFLRESTEDLMEFQLDLLSEADYFLFALAFGIRDKYINLPKFLREFKGLQDTITIQMANYYHRNNNSNLYFELIQPEPQTLVDMFGKASFKEWFAQSRNIDCLKTTIKIPKGEYLLKILGSGIEIVFDGVPKNTNIEVLDDVFYPAIISSKIIHYNKLLAKYKKLK